MKNKVLTVLFAFCPGASQMYQGYMKRGLSLIMMFMANIFVACLFPLLATFLVVIYMFNFFDALNLHASLREGTADPDDYLVHLNWLNDAGLNRLVRDHSLLGWGLAGLGVLGLYQTFLHPIVYQLYWDLLDRGYRSSLLNLAMDLMDKLPAGVLCIVLVVLGLRLVRGPKKHKKNHEMPPVPGEDGEN